jgi:CoA:oxalate CoA-transferase
VDVDYPEGRVGMFGSPIKLSGTPTDARGHAPRLGQHNAEVYADLLGIDPEELQRLKSLGAV